MVGRGQYVLLQSLTALTVDIVFMEIKVKSVLHFVQMDKQTSFWNQPSFQPAAYK